MKRLIHYVVAVPTAGLLLGVAVRPAVAIGIRDARIKNGAVEIRGKNAKPESPITVDGQHAGTSSKHGSFKVTTTNLPPDCVADVSDGIETVQAVIKFCGPVGPEGPPGPPVEFLGFTDYRGGIAPHGGGQRGWATECRRLFPHAPTAHLCTSHELSLAFSLEQPAFQGCPAISTPYGSACVGRVDGDYAGYKSNCAGWTDEGGIESSVGIIPVSRVGVLIFGTCPCSSVAAGTCCR